MSNREELLFTQLLIRSGLMSIEQYQEILEIRIKVHLESGTRPPLDQLLIQKGILDEKAVNNLWQKIRQKSAKADTETVVSLPTESLEKGWEGDILDPPPSPPNYRLMEKLGEGAMGVVFKACHTQDNTLAAIKFLDPRYNTDKELLHRFQREAKAITQLQHPNIVKALETGEINGIYYLAMEYVDGTSLAKILEQGRLEQKRAVGLMLQITQGLHYAHEHGFIHRDIKPQNILVNKQDHAKICDFGLIRGGEQDTLVTRVGSFIGTPQYVSPEQARGVEDLDARTDIYSLGCTFYHMITGQAPYTHDNPVVVLTWQATKPFPDPTKIVPNISLKLANLIRKMTAKERALRLPTLDLAIQRLQEILDNFPQNPNEGTLPSTKRWKKECLEEKVTKTKRVSERRKKIYDTSRMHESIMNKTSSGLNKNSTGGDKSLSEKLKESSSSYASYRKLKEKKKRMLWSLFWWLLPMIVILLILLWVILFGKGRTIIGKAFVGIYL